MDGLIEQPFASAFRGFAVASVLFHVGNQAGIEDHLAIVLGIKATIEVEV